MISAPRRRIRAVTADELAPWRSRALWEIWVVMPTMNTKNGKIRSVGVHPCQVAWASGG
ncbi:hypothetical protein D3C83_140040 [compost metagenome]